MQRMDISAVLLVDQPQIMKSTTALSVSVGPSVSTRGHCYCQLYASVFYTRGSNTELRISN
jgi:hypothetical protein